MNPDPSFKMGEEKTLIQKLKPFALPAIAIGLIINANQNNQGNSSNFLRGFSVTTFSNGAVYRVDRSMTRAQKVRGEWGRYLTFSYLKTYRGRASFWTVEADCQDYTANWLGDGDVAFNPGWQRLKNRRPTISQKVAKEVLDEYCPQMKKLVNKTRKYSKK